MYEDRMWNVMTHTERFKNGIGEQNVLFHSIGRASQLGEVGQALLGALCLASTRLAGDQDGLHATHAMVVNARSSELHAPSQAGEVV